MQPFFKLWIFYTLTLWLVLSTLLFIYHCLTETSDEAETKEESTFGCGWQHKKTTTKRASFLERLLSSDIIIAYTMTSIMLPVAWLLGVPLPQFIQAAAPQQPAAQQLVQQALEQA